jgi:uncharacterized protein YfbU (UPF0304 family)
MLTHSKYLLFIVNVGNKYLNFLLRNCAIGRHWDAEEPLFIAAKMRNMVAIWTGRGKNYVCVCVSL